MKKLMRRSRGCPCPVVQPGVLAVCGWGTSSQAEQHSTAFHRSLRSDSPSDNIAACLTSPANTGSGFNGRTSLLHRFVWSAWHLTHENTKEWMQHTHRHQNTGSQPRMQVHTHTHTVATNKGGGGEGGKTTILSRMKIFPGCHGTASRRPNRTFHHQSHKDGNC